MADQELVDALKKAGYKGKIRKNASSKWLKQTAKVLNDHAPQGERLAYIDKDEENLLKEHGGSGTTENNAVGRATADDSDPVRSYAKRARDLDMNWVEPDPKLRDMNQSTEMDTAVVPAPTDHAHVQPHVHPAPQLALQPAPYAPPPNPTPPPGFTFVGYNPHTGQPTYRPLDVSHQHPVPYPHLQGGQGGQQGFGEFAGKERMVEGLAHAMSKVAGTGQHMVNRTFRDHSLALNDPQAREMDRAAVAETQEGVKNALLDHPNVTLGLAAAALAGAGYGVYKKGTEYVSEFFSETSDKEKVAKLKGKLERKETKRSISDISKESSGGVTINLRGSKDVDMTDGTFAAQDSDNEEDTKKSSKPASKPPASKPAASKPPASKPPASKPPASKPPASTPSAKADDDPVSKMSVTELKASLKAKDVTVPPGSKKTDLVDLYKKHVGNVAAKGMAEGGVVTEPTLAVLGEKGPEAVVPLDGHAQDRELDMMDDEPAQGESNADATVDGDSVDRSGFAPNPMPLGLAAPTTAKTEDVTDAPQSNLEAARSPEYFGAVLDQRSTGPSKGNAGRDKPRAPPVAGYVNFRPKKIMDPISRLKASDETRAVGSNKLGDQDIRTVARYDKVLAGAKGFGNVITDVHPSVDPEEQVVPSGLNMNVVPVMHVAAARYFFSKDDYKALHKFYSDGELNLVEAGKEFTIDTAKHIINKAVAKFGNTLAVSNSFTTSDSDESEIFQEALELRQLLSAIARQQTNTAGMYGKEAQTADPERTKEVEESSFAASDSMRHAREPNEAVRKPIHAGGFKMRPQDRYKFRPFNAINYSA